MGVKRLWNILSPAGRQVSIETLSGKVCSAKDFASPALPHTSRCLPQVLAVDASIWLTQFVKSMRDDEGRMLPNAHILGVFRRLCKVSWGAALAKRLRQLTLARIRLPAAVSSHQAGICV